LIKTKDVEHAMRVIHDRFNLGEEATVTDENASS